jgi:hypothetical protein
MPVGILFTTLVPSGRHPLFPYGWGLRTDVRGCR